MEAKYYRKLNGKVHCYLCPHNCRISEGKYGICRVRKNESGRLIASVYGRLVAKHSDPVEKKPLYHFYPGKKILSIGTAGCNMRCFFCQNCEISQAGAGSFGNIKFTSPEELVQIALAEKNNIGIAYTYNEPSINIEYIMDTATLAAESGLKNVMVSNGFISSGPLKDLLQVVDAFNIDLKAFSDTFYRKYTGSEIEDVKNNLLEIGRSSSHLEITFLVIPGLNDSVDEFRKMLHWIKANLGEDQILHLSRYFPHYKSDIPPTPLSRLTTFIDIASGELNYVFLGNTPGNEGKNSYCPQCGTEVISRGTRLRMGLTPSGECKNCGVKILNYYQNENA